MELAAAPDGESPIAAGPSTATARVSQAMLAFLGAALATGLPFAIGGGTVAYVLDPPRNA